MKTDPDQSDEDYFEELYKLEAEAGGILAISPELLEAMKKANSQNETEDTREE